MGSRSSAPPTRVGVSSRELWSSPTTPSISPLTSFGTVGSVVGARTSVSRTRYSARLVPNVASTAAAEPSALTYIRFAGTNPTVRPVPASQVLTWLTSAVVGEYASRTWAGVRYWPYAGLAGSDTAAACATAPAWLRSFR